MKKVLPILLVALGLSIGKGVYAQDSLEVLFRNTLHQALEIQGMTEPELGFYKLWAPDSFFRLHIVERLLSHPLDVAPYVESVAKRVELLRENPVGLIFEQYRAIDVPLFPRDTVKIAREIQRRVKSGGCFTSGTPDSAPGSGVTAEKQARAQIPADYRTALCCILAGFQVGEGFLNQAVAGLDERELNTLLGEAPDFWRDEEDTVEKGLRGILHREFSGRVETKRGATGPGIRGYDTSRTVKAETLLAYARKIDRRALALSGIAVVMGVRRAVEVLERAKGKIERPVVIDTRWGRVILGSDSDDVYSEDAAVIIDPGGSDRYFSRAGGAVGILGGPFAVVIDLKGNDLYFSSGLFSQGAALFGCGVLVDLEGTDVYRARHYAQGAGIFGTGLLWDAEGSDIYDAGFFAQGAGHYGIGLLIENQGNDSYRAFCYAQGFAGTWGGGTVADYTGNDLYYAGGRYLHEPLLPREFRSFAQGFAIGVRPDAGGGIGALWDFKGNDFYNAEVFGQGTSYWYSLGILFDREGFDHYTAAQYSQGAGIHLSVGALIDEEGNDSYFSRLGPAQGEGHDLSVGVLFDRKGDDGYYASGGQGIGLTNSVGLFLDQDGNDWYMTSESLIGQGSANWARGFSGIGVFLDLAGRDCYPGRNIAADRGYWTKGTYGSGVDLDRPATVVDYEPDVDTSEASIEPVIVAPVESVFKRASIWAVGNARKKVLRARKELIRLGRRALEYVYENKLDTKDGLEQEAVLALVKAIPDTAKPYLLKGLRNEKFLARQNSAYWLGELGEKARDAVDSVILALKEGRITPRRGVYALGSIGDSTVVPEILHFLFDTLEVSRIVTAEACGKLKNPVAIPGLIAALSDRLFTVRSAAEAALVAYGESAFQPILDTLSRLKPPATGHAIRALARILPKLDTLTAGEKNERFREAVVPFLLVRDPFVRLTAVEALAGVMNARIREIMEEALKGEQNLFVVNAYRRVLESTK